MLRALRGYKVSNESTKPNDLALQATEAAKGSTIPTAADRETLILLVTFTPVFPRLAFVYLRYETVEKVMRTSMSIYGSCVWTCQPRGKP